VFVRRLIPLLTVVALVGITSCGDDDEGGRPPKSLGDFLTGNANDFVGSQLRGNWGGRLTQKGLPPFEMAMNFEVGSDPLVAYTGIECGGTWTATGTLDSLPPVYLFDERIDQGKGGECKGTGNVSLHPQEPCRKPEGEPCSVYQHLEYEFRGGGVVSKGVLTRVSDSELERIFDEAGVTPP
jgi:hypothetical protein